MTRHDGINDAIRRRTFADRVTFDAAGRPISTEPEQVGNTPTDTTVPASMGSADGGAGRGASIEPSAHDRMNHEIRRATGRAS